MLLEVEIFHTIGFVPYLWDETRINQYLHCGSTVQIYTVTVYTLRNLAQSQESTTFSLVFYQGVNLLLPLCFPAWWWSPCSRRSRTCGGCWRGTAQSGCPPACPGSSCTSIAGSHQPGWKHQWWRRKTNFWDVPTEIFLITVSSAPSLAPLLELDTWSGRLPCKHTSVSKK